MSKRVRLTNDSLNSYGTRILTAGMNVEQYNRNPVLLYQHERGKVIGYVKEIKVEDGEVTGELVFDDVTELSKQCKKQWEFGSLRMVSVGIDIIEMSEDPKYLVPGQTSPTITKSKLFEVSVVDIGANDDAIVLHREGKLVTFGRDGDCPLPLLNTNQTKTNEMETKTIALQLGLPETATEAEITAKLKELSAVKAEVETLKKEKDGLVLANIEKAVNDAVSEKRITAENKAKFVELGKKIGLQELQELLAAMPVHQKLSAIVGHQGGAPTGTSATYTKLSEVPEDKILELRKNQPEEYKRLYKAEYGIECEL